MKRSLKLLTIVFALLFAALIRVKAEVKEVATEVDLSTALQNGESVKLTNNIENISDIVKVKGTGTVVIDGNGKTVSSNSAKKVFEIYAEGGDLEVIFQNITIVNSLYEGRSVDTRTANITLTIKNSTLKTTSAGNNQPLTIGGTAGPVVVNLNESVIEAGTAGYGIIAFVPANITINKSNITGYSTVYMKEGTEGTKITVKNGSVLTGQNNHSGESDDFGTIALEDGGINIVVEDSKIEVKGTGGAKQVIFSQSDDLAVEKDTKITITGDSVVIAKPEGFFINQETTKLVVEPGVKTNIEVKEEYLPEGVKVEKDESGNYVVVKEQQKEQQKEEIVVENPNTGDNVMLFVILGLIGLIGSALVTNKLIKNS